MRVNCPEEGHYWMRYIRGGPKVPVRIWRAVTPDPDDPTNPMDRSPMMRCKVAGREEIDYEKIVDIGVYRVTAARAGQRRRGFFHVGAEGKRGCQ